MLAGALIFGLSMSVASTVVLIRALQARDIVETEKGRIAVGWLVVEDLAMVFTSLLIPAMISSLRAEGGSAGWTRWANIVFGKSFVAYAIVRLSGYNKERALTISVSLAQIGEFSFILAGLGVALGVMPDSA